jgi:hypothetical protein
MANAKTTEQPQAVFNPTKHLIQLKGKLYLETKFRIQWFREEHPQGCISTEVISLDPVMVKATIYNAEGSVMATAHAGAVDKGNAVWSGRAVEKSETAAIGRALAHAGYGTQFAGVDEAGLVVDPPAQRQTPPQRTNQYQRRQQQQQPDGNLRDKDEAARFIQHWRGQSLADSEVLAALGVTKLSEWTKGRAAADRAVDAWVTAKLSKESA